MGGSSDGVRQDGETLSQMYIRFGREDQIPEPPEVADCVAHLVEWFFELSERRQPSMGGLTALTFQDIQAWDSLLDRQVRPEEIEFILELDRAFTGSARSKPASQSTKSPPTGLFGTSKRKGS